MAGAGSFPKAEGDILYAQDVNSFEKAQLNNFIISAAFSGVSNFLYNLPLPFSFAYKYNTSSGGNTLGNPLLDASGSAPGALIKLCAGSTTSRYFIGSTAYQSSGKIISGTSAFTGSVTASGAFTAA